MPLLRRRIGPARLSLRVDHCALADLLPPARFEVVYSGVISADEPKDAAASRQTHGAAWITPGQSESRHRRTTQRDSTPCAKRVGDEESTLRADANGAWNAHEAIEQLQRLEQFKLAAIEQPVPAEDLEGMKRVRAGSGIPVMADESLVTLEQARRLIELGACDYFNIRLSKTAASPAASPSPSSRMKQASRSKSARK